MLDDQGRKPEKNKLVGLLTDGGGGAGLGTIGVEGPEAGGRWFQLNQRPVGPGAGRGATGRGAGGEGGNQNEDVAGAVLGVVE